MTVGEADESLRHVDLGRGIPFLMIVALPERCFCHVTPHEPQPVLPEFLISRIVWRHWLDARLGFLGVTFFAKVLQVAQVTTIAVNVVNFSSRLLATSRFAHSCRPLDDLPPDHIGKMTCLVGIPTVENVHHFDSDGLHDVRVVFPALLPDTADVPDQRCLLLT